MATGQRPFGGRTSVLVFDAILHANPVSALRVNPALPDALGRILDKALQKNRRLRYQTAADFRADLERLRQSLQAGSGGQPGEEHAVGGDDSASIQPDQESDRPHESRRFTSAKRLAVLGLIVTAIGVVTMLWRREPAVPPFTARQVTTATGWQAEPAIAPVGDVIAYVSNEKGDGLLGSTSSTPCGTSPPGQSDRRCRTEAPSGLVPGRGPPRVCLGEDPGPAGR